MTKGHYQNPAEMLPFEVIAAATQGDTNAMCKVIEHYDGYIAKLCTRTLRDEYGNTIPYVDEKCVTGSKYALSHEHLCLRL
ncbi:MAG: helix-turn-helix domain-containing protein [Oscillospiraceae bacterium]